MAVYSYCFGVIVAILSYVVYQKYVNVYSSFVLKPEKRYDYIIVGAGTSGCVLASRLSEDPRIKVLLIEAGGHMGYFTKIPLTPTAAQQGPNDWSVRTVPQKYSSFGLWDRSQIIPRGKGVGGSGQINFLLHGFGLPEDYERWSRLGFKGWTYQDLKPYFIRAFGTVRSEFDSGICSVDGVCPGTEAPMKLTQIDEKVELMDIFRRSSALLNGKNTVFRKATATVKDGSRVSSMDAYLKPALQRKNLHVLLKTKGVSIRFENSTASSLYILQNNRELNNIFVNKEIILSAGAIKTPQILTLSGIGPLKTLKRLNIKVVSANENVGTNLHDHMNIPLYVSIKKPVAVTLSKVFSFSTFLSYFWSGKGFLSFPPVAGIEYQNNSALVLFTMGSASERLLRDLSNYKHKTFRELFPFPNDTSKEGFMFLASCAQTSSRGTVTLRDASTNVPVDVDPNYLQSYRDVKCMVQAMRRAERLISSPPFQEIGARIHWPRPERCLSFWVYSKDDHTGVVRRKRKVKLPNQPAETNTTKQLSPPDAYLECVLREVAVTGHHVGGTCAGGRVVDDMLRVKSVVGVRVVDASVLPSPVSLFPNSVLVGMAEKAAEIILKS